MTRFNKHELPDAMHQRSIAEAAVCYLDVHLSSTGHLVNPERRQRDVSQVADVNTQRLISNNNNTSAAVDN